jgi:hypothetical protein
MTTFDTKSIELQEMRDEILNYRKLQDDKNMFQRFLEAGHIMLRLLEYDRLLSTPEDDTLYYIFQQDLQELKDKVHHFFVSFDGNRCLEIVGKTEIINTLASNHQYRPKLELSDKPSCYKFDLLYQYLLNFSDRKMIGTLVPVIHDNSLRFSRLINVDSLFEISKGFWNSRQVSIFQFREIVTTNDQTELLRNILEKWNAICHPNCMPILGTFLNRTKPLIVVPYFGMFLIDYLKSKPEMILKTKLGLMLDIVYGLEHLNICGIPHGDVRSKNIMIGNKF